MATVGFEPTISAGERPQTYALDRAATGTGTAVPCILILLKCYIYQLMHKRIALKGILKFTLTL